MRCPECNAEIADVGSDCEKCGYKAASVKEICARSIFLKKGTVMFDGPTDETLRLYEESKKKK